MRVLTYNVQSCRAGVARVADVIESAHPDVVALNEITRKHARALGTSLRMHVAFGQTLRWRAFGNAVLSKERPVEVRAAGFSIASREQRGMVRVTLPGGLVVAATHLGLSGDERVAQAGELVAALARFDRVVLAGDFNEGPDGLAVKVTGSRFRDAFADVDPSLGATFPSSEPEVRADYVFVSDRVRVVEATVLSDVASDHLAVVADLAVG